MDTKERTRHTTYTAIIEDKTDGLSQSSDGEVKEFVHCFAKRQCQENSLPFYHKMFVDSPEFPGIG
jgi:hypothetical protein